MFFSFLNLESTTACCNSQIVLCWTLCSWVTKRRGQRQHRSKCWQWTNAVVIILPRWHWNTDRREIRKWRQCLTRWWAAIATSWKSTTNTLKCMVKTLTTWNSSVQQSSQLEKENKRSFSNFDLEGSHFITISNQSIKFDWFSTLWISH